jgi:hypothetical protein
VRGVATVYLRHLYEDWFLALARKHTTKGGPFALANPLARALLDAG